MSGANGAVVILQTPASSFCMGARFSPPRGSSRTRLYIRRTEAEGHAAIGMDFGRKLPERAAAVGAHPLTREKS